MGNLVTTNKPLNSVASIFDSLFSNESFNIPRASVGNTTPAVNIRENEDEFFLDFAMPGINKDDVTIELDNDLLTVSSELNEVKDEVKGNYTRREFHYASFKRSFILPETVDTTKVKADYKNGVLSISIPKKEEAKPKPVKTIKIGK